jgi:hypothetical protein
LGAVFGGSIALEGYSWSADTPDRLTLFWRKLAIDAGNYVMTLRGVDQEGEIVARRDGQPFRGIYPTGAWPVGVLLPETVGLPVREDGSPPGSGSWLVGLYLPDTMELLPVGNNPDRTDNLVLIDRSTPAR